MTEKIKKEDISQLLLKDIKNCDSLQNRSLAVHTYLEWVQCDNDYSQKVEE